MESQSFISSAQSRPRDGTCVSDVCVTDTTKNVTFPRIQWQTAKITSETIIRLPIIRAQYGNLASEPQCSLKYCINWNKLGFLTIQSQW